MAKRGKRATSSGWDRTAATIGSALGQVAARVDSWKKQRGEIVGEIQKLMRSAEALLSDLGGAATPARRRKGGRPKGYKMSEETKRKLRAAWKRRKAARAAERQS